MELLAPLLHLSAIHLLMAAVPGPNTVTVGHSAAHVSRRAGVVAAAGVAVASLLWVSLSLVGVGALLASAGGLFHLLRLLGAAYLCYVGIRMLRGGRVGAAPAGRGARAPFRAGFMTTVSNPKSAVFWTSVFALVVPVGAPGWFYAVIPAQILLQSFLWYGFIALAFSSAPVRRNYLRLGVVFSRVAGACMIFFGLKIADELRRELALRAV